MSQTGQAASAGIRDMSDNLGGYITLRAASREAAAKLFENYPGFVIFPGDGVEVREILPIPASK